MMEYKCRRCRCLLFKDKSLLTSHGESVMGDTQQSVTENCTKSSTLWYISTEDDCPEWVTKCLNRGEWCKGKLLCPKCRGRLGSFDFTSSQRCSCGVEICPPIHVNKNRVDCFPKKVIDSCTDARNTDVQKDDNVIKKSIMEGTRVISLAADGRSACGNFAGKTLQSVQAGFDGLSLREGHGIENIKQDNPQLISSMKSAQVDFETANCNTNFLHEPTVESGLCEITDMGRSRCLTSERFEGGDRLCSRNVALSSGVRKEASHVFVSKRRSRHKRVASDCSCLQNRQTSDFSLTSDSCRGNTHSSDNLTSLPAPEESHPRLQGNRNLTRKSCGHRRAQSMTVTSNRFEFLQEETDCNISKNLSRSTADIQEQKKIAAERAVAMETPDPPVPDEFICPVCLDLLCNPHSCLPCQHSFCETCLRQLARSQPDKTTCPMCRQVIVQCQSQHPLSFLLKSTYPGHYNRRRKAFRKQQGKLHPLPKLKADLRHKLGLVMQNRLRGQRLREICRNHFIMTFFVYTGAVFLLLGVFLLLILVCCKSLFFLFLLLQWLVFGVMRFANGAAELALMVNPALITTTTDATAANRVILAVIALAAVYKLWTGFWSRDRGAGRT